MYIISSFEHSAYLELAISELEQEGIAKNKILTVPLDKRIEQKKIFDTIRQSDGISLFDGAAVLGTVFMVLGTIYGFVWKWGPIIWGFLGLSLGAVLGFILDFLPIRRKNDANRNRNTEVVLIINCDKDQIRMVENILWDHFALGVGRFDNG